MNITELKTREPQADNLKLDRALSIPGWMYPAEVMWIADQARRRTNIVELGSYLGRSTRALLDNTNGRVLAVDDFQGPRDNDFVDQRDTILDRFKENVVDCKEKLTICKMGFDEVNPEMWNPPFDMIFIDGCHDYSSIRRDIDKWLPFLDVNGLICGHDFSSEYSDVVRAVLETFRNHAMKAPGTDIWFVL